MELSRLKSSNDSTGDTCSSIASFLRQLMSALAKVIWIGMNDTSPAEHGVIAIERDKLILTRECGLAVFTSLNITKVTDVTFLVVGATMLLSKRVIVRAGGGASLSEVAELVNVEAMQTWCQSFKLSCDFAFSASGLFELNNSFCCWVVLMTVRVHHTDCLAALVEWLHILL